MLWTETVAAVRRYRPTERQALWRALDAGRHRVLVRRTGDGRRWEVLVTVAGRLVLARDLTALTAQAGA